MSAKRRRLLPSWITAGREPHPQESSPERKEFLQLVRERRIFVDNAIFSFNMPSHASVLAEVKSLPTLKFTCGHCSHSLLVNISAVPGPARVTFQTGQENFVETDDEDLVSVKTHPLTIHPSGQVSFFNPTESSLFTLFFCHPFCAIAFAPQLKDSIGLLIAQEKINRTLALQSVVQKATVKSNLPPELVDVIKV